MRFHLKVWRQEGPEAPGRFFDYDVDDVIPEMSLLEMLDKLNEELIKKGTPPIVFESDCREGICGTCGMVVNGSAHGPQPKTTTCEIRMRHFQDGETITIEPFRAAAFPVQKDLLVERAGLDKVIQAGGYTSAYTGTHADANAILVPKDDQEYAMDAAACIGCGACVAACPNSSAMLFVAAKIAHLGTLPQGMPEEPKRALSMTEVMQEEGFGACSNHFECQAVCPKGIQVETIARLNRAFLKASLKRQA